jgi:hypothetical protein
VSAAQELVDDLTTLMLRTGPGRDLLPNHNVEISSVAALFGISQPAAARLLQRELPRDHSRWEFNPFGRRYVFALERGGAASAIDAWTINLNSTALLIDVDAAVQDPAHERLKLFLTLVHEWAINLDSKSSAFRYLLDLHEENGPGKAMSLKEFQGYSNLQEPYTETSLRSLRAFVMEGRFLNELQREYVDLPLSSQEESFYKALRDLDKRSCIDRVRRIANELRQNGVLTANWNAQLFEQNMHFLESTRIRVKGQKLSLCVHLADPVFGAPAGYLSEGPRPRIVGW